MFRVVLCVAVALLTFGIAPISAAADDRATCYDDQNEGAIAACNRLITRNPRDAGAYKGRGDAYFKKHDYDRAIADYGDAIRLLPKYAAASNNRGLAYYNMRDYDLAIADFDEAIRLDPKDAVA
jgi:tetratricopeptide (TPR) repeat protein